MDAAISHYPPDRKRSAALPLLHLWQEHFGFISDEAVYAISAKLGLEPINILELVTFYPMLRQQRTGKTHIRVCRTLSCAMAGSYRLMENLCARTGIKPHYNSEGMHNPVSVSPDRNFSIEFVECLASCGTAPVCMVNDELRENILPETVEQILSNRPADGLKAQSVHPLEHRLVFKNIGREGWTTDIDCYLRDGGYEQLRKAVTMSREQIVNEVKTSGLRGRGRIAEGWQFVAISSETGLMLAHTRDIVATLGLGAGRTAVKY